jgi:hypothetical protein
MYIAWHQAAFQRSKKLPTLAAALGEKKAPQMRTNGQMLAMFKSMEKRGIPVTIKRVN